MPNSFLSLSWCSALFCAMDSSADAAFVSSPDGCSGLDELPESEVATCMCFNGVGCLGLLDDSFKVAARLASGDSIGDSTCLTGRLEWRDGGVPGVLPTTVSVVAGPEASTSSLTGPGERLCSCSFSFPLPFRLPPAADASAILSTSGERLAILRVFVLKGTAAEVEGRDLPVEGLDGSVGELGGATAGLEFRFGARAMIGFRCVARLTTRKNNSRLS
ncbi:hypothetical protein B0T22DRAFT_463440 [Podospora appendiculata]|uniref:Secreted protein n=1 Tax=Podospora appendiculata TaxID=314037 RepID=A0AAE0XDI3_9PEZI|nr:hypothetical protein B0T22DRAFT_463440 [Podospora appendiculata]